MPASDGDDSDRFGYSHGDQWQAPWRGAKQPLIEAVHAAIEAGDMQPVAATQTLSGLDTNELQISVRESAYGESVAIHITYRAATNTVTVDVSESGRSPHNRIEPTLQAARQILEKAIADGRDKPRAPLITRASKAAKEHKELIAALGVLAAFLAVLAAFIA